mmetsp:Transcript_21089/g.60860  ORF Transcript_21089/g.60860 Transcript_21089/m.60860 type:complete len:262 (+) Transcript_21089:54-839(+)
MADPDAESLLDNADANDSPSPSADDTDEKSQLLCHSRFIGLFVLLAFPVYGGGQAIVSSGISSVGSSSRHWYIFGCLLIMLNSVMVAAIGGLVYHQMLRPSQLNNSGGRDVETEPVRLWGQRIGLFYLLSRSGEAGLLGFGGICYLQILVGDRAKSSDSSTMLASARAETCYNLGMISLSLGSVALFAFLGRTHNSYSTSIPRTLCLLGVAGYICLAISSGMHIMMSAADFASNVAMCLLIPGSIFELVFGIWVLVKGLHI